MKTLLISLFTLMTLSSAFSASVYFTNIPDRADRKIFFLNSGLFAQKTIFFTDKPALAHDCIIYKSLPSPFVTEVWAQVSTRAEADYAYYITKNPIQVSTGCF